MSTESGPSRLSKTNRADPTQATLNRSAYDSRSVPLTRRDGVTLRQEVRDVRAIDDRATSWRHATERWRDYIEDKSDVEAVFANEAGDEARGSKPHRFHPDYSDKQYAKLKDLERGVSDAYGKRLHTAMLTFTCSSTDDDGHPRPPVDHLDDLLASWSALRRALDRVLDHRRYERLAILEPHQSGYLHCHMAVFVDGRVTRSTFAPVIEAHVRNCAGAEWDAHDLDDDSTISVRHAGGDRDRDDDDALDELAIYLAEYLGTYGDDPLDQAEHVQAANALLWATERQRWRPSNGAQEFMKTPERPERAGNWELVGVEKDGDVIPCGDASGGVDRFTTGALDPPD
jgi:hypothetical protein